MGLSSVAEIELSEQYCVICRDESKDVDIVNVKKDLIQYLNLVNLERLAKKYLKKYLEIKSRESKIEIHGKCRKRFTDS